MVVSIRSDPDNPVTKSVLYHEFSGDGPALLTNHLQDPACVSLLPGTGRRGRYRWHLQWTPMSWWRHQIETFSALLAICAGIHRSPVNSPHKGQWRGALMFSLICAWINGWVNNGEAGDLRCHRAHYDVTVMVETHTPIRYKLYVCFITKSLLTHSIFPPTLLNQTHVALVKLYVFNHTRRCQGQL